MMIRSRKYSLDFQGGQSPCGRFTAHLGSAVHVQFDRGSVVHAELGQHTQQRPLGVILSEESYGILREIAREDENVPVLVGRQRQWSKHVHAHAIERQFGEDVDHRGLVDFRVLTFATNQTIPGKLSYLSIHPRPIHSPFQDGVNLLTSEMSAIRGSMCFLDDIEAQIFRNVDLNVRAIEVGWFVPNHPLGRPVARP